MVLRLRNGLTWATVGLSAACITAGVVLFLTGHEESGSALITAGSLGRGVGRGRSAGHGCRTHPVRQPWPASVEIRGASSTRQDVSPVADSTASGRNSGPWLSSLAAVSPKDRTRSRCLEARANAVAPSTPACWESRSRRCGNTDAVSVSSRRPTPLPGPGSGPGCLRRSARSRACNRRPRPEGFRRGGRRRPASSRWSVHSRRRSASRPSR